MVTEIVLDVPEALRAEIISHAQAGYPEEVCGLIAGRASEPITVHRGRNISPTPRVAYTLDYDTLARQIEFEDQGLTLWGIYHSHPAGPEAPSATDIELAFYPDAIYVIVSLADPERPTVRGFRITEHSLLDLHHTLG